MAPTGTPKLRSLPFLIALALTACLLFSGFVALGTWQVHRRAWKLDLIERVDQRVHAPPTALPERAAWPQITTAGAEYRHVRVTGHYLNSDSTLVHASSRLGYGYWMLTPLRTAAGFLVLVNRGFISADLAHSADYQQLPRPQGRVSITGLLRMSEPKGTLLRSNKPAQGRWYSRDVAAIAKSVGLPAADVAPYFIDADVNQHSGKYPVGGLTVIHFRNAHLSYAITWYVLAGLVLVGAGIVVRYEWRIRSRRA